MNAKNDTGKARRSTARDGAVISIQSAPTAPNSTTGKPIESCHRMSKYLSVGANAPAATARSTTMARLATMSRHAVMGSTAMKGESARNTAAKQAPAIVSSRNTPDQPKDRDACMTLHASGSARKTQ